MIFCGVAASARAEKLGCICGWCISLAISFSFRRPLQPPQCCALFTGAAALIQKAKALGMAVGVGSSGAPSKIQHNLKSSGLDSLLDPKFIVSATEVHAGKPAPDVYLEVLRRLGCEDASRAVVVEDAVHGLVAAKAAGKVTRHCSSTTGFMSFFLPQ